MKHPSENKCYNSMHLFKFCQKILADQKKSKIHDQEVGSILNFNPSDCSHWKKGAKNIKSVFSLNQLATYLHIEPSLVYDIASGLTTVNEAYYEHNESIKNSILVKKIYQNLPANEIVSIHQKIDLFIKDLHKENNFTTSPLYLPEIFKCFPFIQLQPVEMNDRLSRILRVKPGQYTIQFKKADLKPQTRLSIIKNLAKIIFEGERHKFPQLKEVDEHHLSYEKLIFTANLLIPKQNLRNEIININSKKNLIQELSIIFWAPKSLICFQLQSILRNIKTLKKTSTYDDKNPHLQENERDIDNRPHLQ